MRDAGGSAGTAAIDAGRRRSSDAGIRADAGNRIRDVPDIPYCNLAAGWTDEDIASEQTLFQWINEWRASLSMNCGGRGPCGGLRRLQMSPELRCSARRHSFDMAQPGAAFDTIDSKGKTPRDRIESAGLTPRAWGESIAQGSPTNAAQQLVMKAQMATAQSGDAEFINPQYTLVGIGNYGEFWTVDFADL
jgi:uncharacterized protein YkwD